MGKRVFVDGGNSFGDMRMDIVAILAGLLVLPTALFHFAVGFVVGHIFFKTINQVIFNFL